jgi:hypothetical protein
MEDRHSLYKVKEVVMWLRFGYVFFKKARVGSDLAQDDEDVLTEFIYGYHLPVSACIRSAGAENR